MKKIISLILICIAVLGVLCLAACGNDNVNDEIGNDITSMMDDATTLMDEMSEDLSDFGNDLTENGNVTDETENGIRDDLTDEATTEECLFDGEETDVETTVAE